MHEAKLEDDGHGLQPTTDGWFIVNLSDISWETTPGGGTWCGFGVREQAIGVGVHILMPGDAPGFYHAESTQEGFLVLSGECIAVVEGEERRMRQWDYFHSPPGTEHITVGAGEEPCAILMFGAPDPRRKVSWIANETAAKHDASVARTTSVGTEVYGEDLPPVSRVPPPKPFGTSPSSAR